MKRRPARSLPKKSEFFLASATIRRAASDALLWMGMTKRSGFFERDAETLEALAECDELDVPAIVHRMLHRYEFFQWIMSLEGLSEESKHSAVDSYMSALARRIVREELGRPEESPESGPGSHADLEAFAALGEEYLSRKQ